MNNPLYAAFCIADDEPAEIFHALRKNTNLRKMEIEGEGGCLWVRKHAILEHTKQGMKANFIIHSSAKPQRTKQVKLGVSEKIAKQVSGLLLRNLN